MKTLAAWLGPGQIAAFAGFFGKAKAPPETTSTQRLLPCESAGGLRTKELSRRALHGEVDGQAILGVCEDSREASLNWEGN